MTYAYGMKGAPAVGNGLGGLPSRYVATSTAVASTKYDITLLGAVTFTTMTSNINRSVPILFNGKGLQYVVVSGPSAYRFSFDYNDSGVSNIQQVNVSSVNSIPYLPIVDNVSNSSNCLWSYQISNTQALYKYEGMLPFLVTWDGVNNSSFISITDPASVLMGYSDAFILPSGNLICFGHSTTNAGLLRLAEYTPSLTLVRSMPLITMSNLLTGAGRATVKIRVKKTSYGYIVAAQHNDAATGVDLAVMTLDSTCTSVISSRTGRVQNAAAEAGTVMQSVIGEKGAMLMQRLGTKFGSANYFVNSNGVINTSVANQYVFNSQTFPTSSEMGVASLYEQSGCTVFADGNAPSFYVASNNIYSGYAFLTGGAAGNESQTPATYVDIQTEPMINKYTTQSQDIYPASIDRTVNGVYSAYAAGWTGTQMCYDQNGFIWWNYGDSAAEKGKFFKREYR